jgi:hypothetical protein
LLALVANSGHVLWEEHIYFRLGPVWQRLGSMAT